MISLEVQDYCQQCPEFIPDVDKNDRRETLYTNDIFSSNGIRYVTIGEHDTTIRCAHRVKCECLKNFIEQEAEKKEKKNVAVEEKE